MYKLEEQISRHQHIVDNPGIYLSRLEVMKQGQKDMSRVQWSAKDKSIWSGCNKHTTLTWDWERYDFRIKELTLLDKLEARHAELDNSLGHIKHGFREAIDIVKQHTESNNA